MPWVKPWMGAGLSADHHNAASGHAYMADDEDTHDGEGVTA